MPEEPRQEKDAKEAQLSSEDRKKFSEMTKFLSRAFVQTHTFGPEHPLAKQPIEQCFALLNNLIQEKGSIAIYTAEKKLRYGNTVLEPKNPVVDRLIVLFNAVQLVSLEFETGFSHQDFLRLLSIFAKKPEDIIAGGGIEKVFKEKNIGHLKLNPIKYELIGMHERVISEESKVAEEALKELEEKRAEKEDEPESKEKEEKPKDELLSLIDESLKEDTEQSLFVDKLTANPLEVVNLIIGAIRLLNKVGGEDAKAIISSIINKLALVGDDLYRCLTEGKEDKTIKETYKAAGMLGKELTKQIKNIQISADLESNVKEMTTVLTVLLDQIEAQRILSTFSKGELTLNKKAALLKKIMQRQKSSAEFELLMQRLLVLKGMSEQEVENLFSKKEEMLKEVDQQKEAVFTEGLTQTLQKLKEGRMSLEEAVASLKEMLKKKAP